MKLKQITIKNFRCFEELEISLHENLTVLTALNGGGKTTILDAIRIALWPYIKGFDLGVQNGKGAKTSRGPIIHPDDVRISMVKGTSMEPQYPACISSIGEIGVLEYGDSLYKWAISRVNDKPMTGIKYDGESETITRAAEEAQDAVRNGEEVNDQLIRLPVVSYFGTGRIWYQWRHDVNALEKKLDVATKSRTWAYQNSLGALSRYKQFEDWYAWIFRSFRELQIDEIENNIVDQNSKEYFGAAIKVVQDSINEFTKLETGWYDLQYRSSQNQQMVMKHDDYGYVPLSLLSDGLRNIVALVCDIAFRCFNLNPQHGFKAAQETDGIVLIDEVDMFLHPSWQQRVVTGLRQAFPKIQFVLTSHSPQVLTTVPSECIRIIENGEVHSAPAGSKGAESSRILKRIFGVDARPQSDENTQLLKAYEQLVYADKWDTQDAIDMRTKLDEIFAGEEPKLVELDLYIENRSWELDLEKDQ